MKKLALTGLFLITLLLTTACADSKQTESTNLETTTQSIVTEEPESSETVTQSITTEAPTITESVPEAAKNVAVKFASITNTKIASDVTAGILFDQEGTMYVSKNSELLKLTPAGEISTFCTLNNLPRGKNYIYPSPLIWGMTFDDDGNILAAAQDRVLKISPKGQITTLIRQDFEGFLGCTGIDMDQQGNIFITNGGKIEKYTSDMKKSTFIDATELGCQQFFTVKFDPEYKNLYVADFYTRTLIKYELDSKGNVKANPQILVTLPEKKPNPYHFGTILNIVFSESNTLYASIDGMGKILSIDPSGTINYLELGSSYINNHMIAFGKKGFDEECLYITTMAGQSIYQFNVGEKNAYVYNIRDYTRSKYSDMTNDNIDFKIVTKRPKHTMKKIILRMTNNRSEPFSYGYSCEFDIKLDGEWYCVPQKDSFTYLLTSFHLKSSESFDFPLDLSKYILHGEGTYRVVKNINENESIAVEFQLK